MNSLTTFALLLLHFLLTAAVPQTELPDIEGTDTAAKKTSTYGAPTPASEPTPAPASEPPEVSAGSEKPHEAAAPEPLQESEGQLRKLARSADTLPAVQNTYTSIILLIDFLGEFASFPAFPGTVFVLMVAGIVNYAFQLTLTKLVVLMKGGFNLREIAADMTGLLTSLGGLILTAQSPLFADNFLRSPSMVVAMTGSGVALGLLLYRWAQKQEVHATQGERARLRQKK